MAELRETLQGYYKSAGVKNIPIMLCVTDAHIVDDKFLVYFNNLLSTGWIPGLFDRDDLDGVLSSLRSEAKAAGVQDTREANIQFFVSRVRKNLHVVLCSSPVGKSFRIRSRRFPGLINCTTIDW